MSLADDSAQRLARLSVILDDGSRRRHTTWSNPVDEHLASLRLDRVQQLAREVESRSGRETDELDRVAMRLLLDEFASALFHMRAVAREAAKNMERGPAALKDVRRYVEKEREIEIKQLAATAPSD